MTLLRLLPTGPQWPYSVTQFRADEPRLSISNDPMAGELASYAELEPPILVFQVQPTDPPAYDPATHRAEETTPICADGVWQQAWQLIELPPPAPTPDWATFRGGLLISPEVAALMGAARESGCEPAVTALPVALEKAQTGDLGDFAACWALVARDGAASPELIAQLVATAEACHLPEAFIASLQPVMPET
jgi:hypothetical protein